ncbi:Calcineurin-like phosphoesterase domain, apaH type [Parasponia andersonii]|uniref:acid phosphatase n=1 Tax=Parasponia andersonii TaxID=3476 RepID=A0A2P5AF84_PARAD|nr:Calcineurin-like phosphoesterase domain, apaH type [Parasponia andersonii]
MVYTMAPLHQQRISLLAAPCIGLTFVFWFNTLMVTSFAELERYEHPSKDDGPLSLLVIGDWGRNGRYNQSNVALQMGRIGEKLDIDFVISTGDNFYENGLKETAEFFFVDASPFVDSYFVETDHTYDWRGVPPRLTYLAILLKDLEITLRESTAKWKIVVGHHAIRSAGHHGDTSELIQNLLPLLEANDVDLYINGHDHSLEHISSSDSAIQFLTSGACSKAWRGDLKENTSKNGPAMKFFYDGLGFMSLQLNRADAEFVFYDVFGQVLHTWKVSKHPYSSI